MTASVKISLITSATSTSVTILLLFEISIQSCILSTTFGIVRATFSKDINFVTKVYPTFRPYET